jgi:hypothetical protein
VRPSADGFDAGGVLDVDIATGAAAAITTAATVAALATAADAAHAA